MRTEMENKELYDNLIKLSHIFQEGYNIKVIGNTIFFHTNINKPINLNYKIILELKEDSILFSNGKIPDICIIKGWYNKKNETYYIGLETEIKL